MPPKPKPTPAAIEIVFWNRNRRDFFRGVLSENGRRRRQGWPCSSSTNRFSFRITRAREWRSTNGSERRSACRIACRFIETEERERVGGVAHHRRTFSFCRRRRRRFRWWRKRFSKCGW